MFAFSGSAYAADCARYDQIIAPITGNFSGIPTNGSGTLQTPILGAESCSFAMNSGSSARNGLRCIWRYHRSGETNARQFLSDWVSGLAECRLDQRPAKSTAPMKQGEVERIIYKAVDGNEAWFFSLIRSADQTWTVAVSPSRKSQSISQAGSETPLSGPTQSPQECEPFRTFVEAAQNGFSGIPTHDVGGDLVLSKTFFGLNVCIRAPNGRGGRCVTEDRRATGFVWADNKQAAMSAQAARCLAGWTQSAVAPKKTNYRETVLISPDGRVRFGINYSYYEPVATLTAFSSLVEEPIAPKPIAPNPAAPNPATVASRHPPPSCASLEEMLVPVRANFRNSRVAAVGTPFLNPPVAGAETCVPIRRTSSNYAASLSCTWRIDASSDTDARSTYAQWVEALKACKPQNAPQSPKPGATAGQIAELTLGEQFAHERWSISLHHDNPYRIMITGLVRDVPP